MLGGGAGGSFHAAPPFPPLPRAPLFRCKKHGTSAAEKEPMQSSPGVRMACGKHCDVHRVGGAGVAALQKEPPPPPSVTTPLVKQQKLWTDFDAPLATPLCFSFPLLFLLWIWYLSPFSDGSTGAHSLEFSAMPPNQTLQALHYPLDLRNSKWSCDSNEWLRIACKGAFARRRCGRPGVLLFSPQNTQNLQQEGKITI